MHTTLKTIALAAAVTTLSFAGTVQAQEKPAVEVGLYGYDLTNAVAVQHLKQRVERAAKSVCGVGEINPLSDRAAKLKCYREARQIALAQVEARVALANSGKAELTSR